jgi:hypothetical protein
MRVTGDPRGLVLDPRTRMHTAAASLGSAVGVQAESITAISLAVSANQPNVVAVVATISDRLRTKKKARHRTPHRAWSAGSWRSRS